MKPLKGTLLTYWRSQGLWQVGCEHCEWHDDDLDRDKAVERSTVHYMCWHGPQTWLNSRGHQPWNWDWHKILQGW